MGNRITGQLRAWVEILLRRDNNILNKFRFNNRELVVDQYRRKMGREPDLENPRRFSEKLQWMKLYYNDPLYARCADKYGVREFVERKGFGGILNTLYGVYDSADNIDLDALPDKFVIKATHGCGWNLICKDKEKLRPEWKKWRRKMNRWLRQDYSLAGRELHYTHITPRLVCERFLENGDGTQISDYKIFCFDGEPKMIQVDYDRHTNHTRNYHRPDWSLFEVSISLFPNKVPAGLPPVNLDRMLEISRALSEGFPHVRVDLYDVDGQVWFGEMTFIEGNGHIVYEPDSMDFTVGEWMKLPGEDSPYVLK